MKEIRVTAHGADILPIDALIEFQGNLKTITRENLDKLKRSILKHGFTAPIFVWNGVDYHILDGHQRLKALIELRQEGYNIPLLPVVYIDADSEEHAKEKLLYITSQYGDFTTEGFAEFVSELDFDFDDIRLTEGEFSIDFGQTEETTGDDDAPELAEGEPDSKLGELYELGPHRLMCGDSTDAEQVARLMRDEKADMVFTDPPYNVGSESKGVASSVSKAHKNLMEAEWDKDFQIETPLNCGLSVMAKDCAVYVCTSHYLAGRIWAWMKEWSDFYYFCVWSKPDPMPSLMKRHWTWDTELIPYATRGKHVFNVESGHHSPSTWRINKQQGAEKTGHPTQKPVAVPQHAIKKSSRSNQIVLDLFGGSGSTLIACAKTERQCRMMELDPQYCDVIRRRWTKWARENGKDVGTGELEPMEI